MEAVPTMVRIPAHFLQKNVAQRQETPFLGLMKHKWSCFKKTEQGSCSQAANSLTLLKTHLQLLSPALPKYHTGDGDADDSRHLSKACPVQRLS